MRNTTQKFIIDQNVNKSGLKRRETVEIDEGSKTPKNQPNTKETDISLAVPNMIITDEQKRMSIGLNKQKEETSNSVSESGDSKFSRESP